MLPFVNGGAFVGKGKRKRVVTTPVDTPKKFSVEEARQRAVSAYDQYLCVTRLPEGGAYYLRGLRAAWLTDTLCFVALMFVQDSSTGEVVGFDRMTYTDVMSRVLSGELTLKSAPPEVESLRMTGFGLLSVSGRIDVLTVADICSELLVTLNNWTENVGGRDE